MTLLEELKKQIDFDNRIIEVKNQVRTAILNGERKFLHDTIKGDFEFNNHARIYGINKELFPAIEKWLKDEGFNIEDNLASYNLRKNGIRIILM